MPRGRLRPAPQLSPTEARPSPTPQSLSWGPSYPRQTWRVSTAQQHTTSTDPPRPGLRESSAVHPSSRTLVPACHSRASKAVVAAKLSQNPTPTADSNSRTSAPLLPNPSSSFYTCFCGSGREGTREAAPVTHSQSHAPPNFVLSPSRFRVQREPSPAGGSVAEGGAIKASATA